MIVIGSILAIVLIGAYIFLGMKISESIVHSDVKLFFWALYTTTLFTLVNISISIFFYSSLYNKKGPLGPRGIKGKLGDAGDSGDCGSDSDIDICKVKTVQIMIEEAIQNKKNENDITPKERKLICNIVNHADNKNIINNWNLQKLKAFYAYFDKDNNAPTIISEIDKLNNYSIDQRINRQNNDQYNLTWLKGLIETGSSLGDGGRPIDPEKRSEECV